jgi:hypothetical protein
MSSMTVGSSTMGTRVESMRIATASPRPKTFRMWSGSSTTTEPNTKIMMVAAAVITRPLRARPSATANELSPVSRQRSAIWDSRNTSESMDSPNGTVNSTTGIQGSIGEMRPMANTCPSHPHWNTATITP